MLACQARGQCYLFVVQFQYTFNRTTLTVFKLSLLYMNDKDWAALRETAEYLNIVDSEKLLELLETGFEGEIKSNYPTINTLKCQIKLTDEYMMFYSNGTLLPETGPPPVTYQHDGYGLLKKFLVQTGQLPFELPKGLAGMQYQIAQDKITGKIDQLNTIVEQKPCYLRSLHETSQTGVAHAAAFFQTSPFRAKEMYRAAGLFKFKILNQPFSLFDFELKAKRYLIVDVNSHMLKEDFKRVIEAIIIVYAFVTGHYLRGKRYTIYSLQPDFTHINCFDYHEDNGLAKSGITALSPRNIGELHPELTGKEYIAPTVFSKLVEDALNSDSILRAYQIMADSLDYPESVRGAVYAVVLETLKDQLIAKAEVTAKPIKETEYKHVIQTLKEVIIGFPNSTFNDRNALLKKIDNFNTIGNLDGLYKIFEDQGIKLNEHDKETIKHRNNFLHGRLPSDKKNTISSEKYLTGITLKMHLLISALLLTGGGYEGHYLNYYKYRYPQASGEEVFRQMKE
jgi:hypothetical protein